MEIIKALREKHKVPNTENLNDLIGTTFPRTKDNLKKQEQRLSELKIKLEEQRWKVATLDETLNAEKHTLSVKLEESMRAGDTLRELEADRNNLLLEVHQLESERNRLKNIKPSKKDQETIERGQKKLDYYKQLTGIRWDYGAPKETIKGYVKNGKDHLHTFNYENKEQDNSKLEDVLWNHVLRGTGRSELLESDCKQKSVPEK